MLRSLNVKLSHDMEAISHLEIEAGRIKETMLRLRQSH